MDENTLQPERRAPRVWVPPGGTPAMPGADYGLEPVADQQPGGIDISAILAGSAPGSLPALRASNERLVVEALQRGGAMTQAQITRVTGLSKATVSNIVTRLAERNLVTIRPTTAGGRRANEVALVTSDSVAVGVELSLEYMNLVLVTLNHEVLQHRYVPQAREFTTEQRFECLQDQVNALLAEAGVVDTSNVVVGLSLPVPVDMEFRELVADYVVPHWLDLELLPQLRENLPWKVVVANDAVLGALGQITWAGGSEYQNLVYVQVGPCVGAGVVANGQILHGQNGLAGGIAHAQLLGGSTRCYCGNRGCVDTVCSLNAMIMQLELLRAEQLSLEDFLHLIDAGDTVTWRILNEVAWALGQIIARVANLVDPQLIIVGGPLNRAGNEYLNRISQAFDALVLPLIGKSCRIEFDPLTPSGVALGAGTLAIRAAGVFAEGIPLKAQ